MRSPPSISVDNNFASRQACVGRWSTHVEFSRRINDDFGVLEHFLGDYLLDDLLGQNVVDGFVADFGVVLS